MELKITIEAEGIDPVVAKVDIPIKKTRIFGYRDWEWL